MPAEPRPRSRAKTWAVVWALLLLIAAAGTAYDVFYGYPSRPGPGEGVELEVEIPKGIGPDGLASLLEEKGIIAGTGRFKLWLRLTGVLQGLKAGSFILRDDMTPVGVVAALSGRDGGKGLRVTVPEGFTLREIGEALARAGVCGDRLFLEAATSAELMAELDIPASTAEGFLFPDTYFLSKETSPANVVRRMHRRFREKWADLERDAKADLLRTVTMASIVQAEARVADEMPTIAGVYENRLNGALFSSRLLQADPAVAYGCEPGPHTLAPSCEELDGRLRRRQLEDEKNPYNTYRHPGLPPGPICAPGEEALKAALSPKKVPYLYFVAGKNGRHRFSKTLREHNAAVDLYLEGR